MSHYSFLAGGPAQREVVAGAVRLATLGVALFIAGQCAQAQTWRPLRAGGDARAEQIVESAVFAVPQSILSAGGVIKALLVGGGQGGSASWSSCDDSAIQGGAGGNGGEVVEVEIPLVAGQCAQGLVINIGRNGRGAYRGGNQAGVGEAGGATTISCAGSVIAQALGGGVKADSTSSVRGVRGGQGAVVSNGAEAVKTVTFDQRTMIVKPAFDGDMGYLGYGSSGGGGA